METNEKDAKKFCSQCGTELEPEALFCSSCGAKQANGGAAKGTTAPVVAALKPERAPQPQPVAPNVAVQMQQPMYSQPPQGYSMQQGYPQQQGYQQPQMIITQSPKSMGLALILTFLFGPLGLLYASVKAGVILICIAIVVGFLTLGLGAIVIWPISMVWAYMEVDKYNKALMNGQMPPQSF